MNANRNSVDDESGPKGMALRIVLDAENALIHFAGQQPGTAASRSDPRPAPSPPQQQARSDPRPAPSPPPPYLPIALSTAGLLIAFPRARRIVGKITRKISTFSLKLGGLIFLAAAAGNLCLAALNSGFGRRRRERQRIDDKTQRLFVMNISRKVQNWGRRMKARMFGGGGGSNANTGNEVEPPPDPLAEACRFTFPVVMSLCATGALIWLSQPLIAAPSAEEREGGTAQLKSRGRSKAARESIFR